MARIDLTHWRAGLGVPNRPTQALLAMLLTFAFILWWNDQLGAFFSLGNLKVLLRSSSTLTVVALGMLLIILSGGIDLSVGSVVALVTVVSMQVYRLIYNGPNYVLPTAWTQWLEANGWLWQGAASSTWASVAAILSGVLTGGLCGLCNGLVVTRLRVVPFVATLGMLSFARGMAYWLSGKTTITFIGPRPAWVDAFAKSSSDTFIVSPSVWSAVLLAALLAVVLRGTIFGRYSYAIGANEAAAWRSGVPTDRTKLGIYLLAGLFTGWAGVLLFAYGSGGDPGAAVGLELDAIAAVVIGGASLSGGKGSVGGTLLGVLMLASLDSALVLLSAGVEVKNMLIGVIIIAGMALSGWKRSSRDK